MNESIYNKKRKGKEIEKEESDWCRENENVDKERIRYREENKCE